jgi:hypothetical protein
VCRKVAFPPPNFWGALQRQKERESFIVWLFQAAVIDRNKIQALFYGKDKTMWKKLMDLMTKKQKNNSPAKQLRSMEQYFQLILPLR